MSKHHDLKTDHEVFIESLESRKPWEIRKNDRNFQEGDTVTLRETFHSGEAMADGAPLDYTGRNIHGVIKWVLQGPAYGLSDGWCIFTVDIDQ